VTGAVAERVEEILAIAREILSRPTITADDELTQHGGTSLSIVRIVAVASRTLDVDIDPRDIAGAITVRNLALAATPARASWQP
jgi:acyl carrier protein